MDARRTLLLSGTGDVIEPDEGVIAIGSGGSYALAAARALLRHTQLPAAEIARESLRIAGEICIYTNEQITVEELSRHEHGRSSTSRRARSSASSTATSSVRPRPSAPSRSRCATAGAGMQVAEELRDEIVPEEHHHDRPDRRR